MLNDNLLSPSDIPIGIPLPWSIADGNGRLLLHKGYVIARQITVNSLFASCVCQIMPEDEEEELQKNQDSEPDSSRFPLDDLIDLANRLKSCFDQPESCGDFPGTVSALASELQRIVVMDTDMAMGFIFLKTPIEKKIKQTLDNAIICEAVGNSMRMTTAARRTLVSAVLTLGLTANLPDSQDGIPGLISVFAGQRLRQLGVTEPDWLNAVAQFHELKQDSQQPLGLSLDCQGLETRLIYLASSYTDSLASMSKSESMASYQVMRDIFMESGRGRDPVLGGYFIKALGSYPVGCRVELQNGETGVVIRRNSSLNNPLVMILTNSDKQKLRIPMKRDTNIHAYRISSIINSDAAEPLDPYLLWGYLPLKSHG
ncbi:MAG: hypothetical protein ACR2HF_13130 [Methylococcaceae bacterium]